MLILSADLGPNLDRLAGRGVRFNNAWVQYPLCNHIRTSYPDMVTLPRLFKNSGYDSIGIGNVFHDSANDLPS